MVATILFIQTGEVREAKKYIRTYEKTYNEEGLHGAPFDLPTTKFVAMILEHNMLFLMLIIIGRPLQLSQQIRASHSSVTQKSRMSFRGE